jgi:Tfp pilus assembly protein FimT
MLRSQTAYTLLEAMIALSIIVILAGISIPSLKNMLVHHHNVILQSQLLQTINLARQEAYSRGVSIIICKSKMTHTCGGDWSDGLLVFSDVDGNGILKDEQYIVSRVPINVNKGKLHWRAFPVYRDYLRFRPRTWLAADNGMFWYCPKDWDYPSFAVMINTSGSGRVIYPDKSGELKDSRHRLIHC